MAESVTPLLRRATADGPPATARRTPSGALRGAGYAPGMHLLLLLPLGCLSFPTRPPTTTEVGASADGQVRLVLTEQLRESFPDSLVTYRLALDGGPFRRWVLYTDTLQAQALQVTPAETVDGALTWAIREDVCVLRGEEVRCVSLAGLEDTFYAERGLGCCAGATAAVQCSCGFPAPDPTLREAYRWAADQTGRWGLARGAAAALVALDDPGAPARVAALRRQQPGDPLVEALEAAADPAAQAVLVAGLGARSLGERLQMARACVPALAAPLRASAATEAAQRQARLAKLLALCP